ncbi:MAG: hypothetical protein ACFCAD_21705 [Pleurocapsa sp.]
MSQTSTETSQNIENSSKSTEAYKATQYLLRRIVPPQFYYRLRTFNRRYPWLFLPFARWRWRRWRKKYNINYNIAEPATPFPLEKDTDIVIEAYPRCGNTFAHIAFKFAQDREVNIAHHTHAAAQVIAGVKNKVPTLVIIRPAEDAIVSYLVGGFDPGLTVKQALREYISFYSLILPYRDRFILATFQELTGDYGAVIKRVNRTYGTDFDEFDHTEANVQECFAIVDRGYENAFGDLSKEIVSRPSDSRTALKEKVRQKYRQESPDKLRNKAEQIYTLLTQKNS